MRQRAQEYNDRLGWVPITLTIYRPKSKKQKKKRKHKHRHRWIEKDIKKERYKKRPIKDWQSVTSQDWFNKFVEPPIDMSLRCGKRMVGFGVLTGEKSNIIIFDIDNIDDTVEEWHRIIGHYGDPITPKALSPSQGYHYYFQYDCNNPLRTCTRCLRRDQKDLHIDIRSDKGCVVCPPSSQGGSPYQWIRSPFEYEMIPVPAWLLQYVIEEN